MGGRGRASGSLRPVPPSRWTLVGMWVVWLLSKKLESRRNSSAALGKRQAFPLHFVARQRQCSQRTGRSWSRPLDHTDQSLGLFVTKLTIISGYWHGSCIEAHKLTISGILLACQRMVNSVSLDPIDHSGDDSLIKPTMTTRPDHDHDHLDQFVERSEYSFRPPVLVIRRCLAIALQES